MVDRGHNIIAFRVGGKKINRRKPVVRTQIARNPPTPRRGIQRDIPSLRQDTLKKLYYKKIMLSFPEKIQITAPPSIKIQHREEKRWRPVIKK
jgi:hypothetical protein